MTSPLNKIETREILVSYLTLIINRTIKSSEDLRDIIIKTFNLGGLSKDQYLFCVRALDLKELANSQNYSNEDIISLINKMYDLLNISMIDYFYLISLSNKKKIINNKTAKDLLKAKNIPINLINPIELSITLEELSNFK